ncbi:unnamed protein product [Pedinophyceae sp. YPF-701]|nr:unnamed protein product [Pedinophyceae sp. YPF-701]
MRDTLVAAADDEELLERMRAGSPGSFDRSIHYFDPNDEELTARCCIVVDALNFCFWPAEGLQYEHLSEGVRDAARRDPACVSPDRLAAATPSDVRGLFNWDGDIPQLEERTRLVREVGGVLRDAFGGQVASLVRSAGGCGVRLSLLTAQHFPGFRDSAVHDGAQVFFHKRAQIFAGDLWGVFRGEGLGKLDVSGLTAFADYRVPVVLRQKGILKYERSVAQAVDQGALIVPGTPQI